MLLCYSTHFLLHIEKNRSRLNFHYAENPAHATSAELRDYAMIIANTSKKQTSKCTTWFLDYNGINTIYLVRILKPIKLKTRTKIEYPIKRQTNQASVGCCLISLERVLKNGVANTQPTATINPKNTNTTRIKLRRGALFSAGTTTGFTTVSTGVVFLTAS